MSALSVARRTLTRRELRAPLVPYEDALRTLVATVEPLPAVEVPLREAAGLVTAERIVARIDVPGFDSSAMDGYAIRAADVARAPAILEAGSFVKVMTGAPIPSGADTVVPWEDTEPLGDSVAILADPQRGANVRPRAEDLRAGDGVVAAGTRVRAVHLGVLASLGHTHVRAHPRPRVALLSTGDEIVPPGEPLPRGGMHDANSSMLWAFCEAAGARVTLSDLVRDDPDQVGDWLARAAQHADLIVTTGGASVGERDWTRAVIERDGRLLFWRVAVKPGKPVAFGHVHETPVLALPGNPGSAFACAHAFVARAIRLLGRRDPHPPTARASLASDVAGSRSRTVLCRARVERGRAVPLPAQSSVVLSNLIPAHGFAVVPPGGLRAGADVTVELFE